MSNTLMFTLAQNTGTQPAVGATPASTPTPRSEVIGAPTGTTSTTSTTTTQQTTGAQPAGQGQQQSGPGMLFLMLPLLLLFGFMFWTQSRTAKKERQRRDELMNSLRTNDQVQTIGGIIGRVAEVRDEEVVLRVDESSNTRIRFHKSAIQQVVSKSGGSASSQSEAKPLTETAKA